MIDAVAVLVNVVGWRLDRRLGEILAWLDDGDEICAGGWSDEGPYLD